MMNNPLLHRYVTERSEPAFAELVRQHIDLVYSAALRQVNGDATDAQDVTQAVFTDLARKAPRLLRHPSLTGWLYTSTRYQSAKARRSEQRRVIREQEAHAMNQLLQSADSDPAWQELRPVLDEAMHDLAAADREAVLLRFFERRSLAEIAARLGLTEDTARKRVARALDKLRAGLARRGITSTMAALTVALAERTVGAAPAGMAGQVSHAAMAAGAASGGSIAILWKLLAGAGAAATVAGLIVLPRLSHQKIPAAAGTASVQSPALAVVASSPAIAPMGAPALNPIQPGDPSGKLVLHIVTADSGRPIPDVTLEYWLFTANGTDHQKPLTGSPQGVCEVPVPRVAVKELILVSQREGFADTRLQWHVDRGETIPPEYTLRLARAVTIGGTVVDADGSPVADATVRFGNEVDPAADAASDTSNFGWPFGIATTSDGSGHWQVSRVARETLRTVSGEALHPLHVLSRFEAGNPDAQKQLLAGTYEFRLGRAVEARGRVVDASGQPVPAAKITVGMASEVHSRYTTSGSDGQFQVAGCQPGQTTLSAEAEGFAPTTLKIDLNSNAGPFRLTLRAGKLLRLRVVDTAGKPVPKTDVWFDWMTFGNGFTPAPVQTEFHRKTGPDGRVEWSGAPEGELTFDFAAPGHMRVDHEKVAADGQEHLITLPPALTISGTVRDAATGSLIPSFRIVAGWPETNIGTGAVSSHWSSIDRFWLSFTGGKFQHSWEEAAVGGTLNPSYIFKVEAEGYAPFVTRPVALNEGDVQFEIALQAATSSVVTVNLPDGSPAAGVDIGIVSPGTGLQLVPGGFSRHRLPTGGSLLLTDSQGRFTLEPDDAVTIVIAAGVAGYAEATPAALATAPVMVLQPWGRLEGILLAQGIASTNSALLFHLGTGRQPTGASADFSAYQVKTDSAGHFVFAQVPPGKHQLMELIEVRLSSSPAGMAWINHPLTNVDIRPGETTTMTVNSPGPRTTPAGGL